MVLQRLRAALSGAWSWLSSYIGVRASHPDGEVYMTKKTADVPDAPSPRTVYVVGEGEHQWYAVLACPCLCGAIVQLSLLENDRPRWTLTEHGDRTISLSPSVLRRRGCQSHFFLRRGRIEWSSDTLGVGHGDHRRR